MDLTAVWTLRRRAARVVLFDPDDRVLLLAAKDPGDPAVPAWWELPGGGIEPGETTAEAGAREVWEETGLRARMGPAVWLQHAVFDFGGYHFDQHETIHIARCDGGDVHPAALEALEAEAFLGWQWCRPDGLAAVAATARVIPDWLPTQLPAMLATGVPSQAIDMGELA